MTPSDRKPTVIVKRGKRRHAGHHGGAWKLAYADFMTAMMAFFLLLWLLSSATAPQLKGIAEYFRQPLKISLYGGERSAEASSPIRGGGSDVTSDEKGVSHNAPMATDTAKRPGDVQQEKDRQKALELNLRALVNSSPKLSDFKQQIRIDSTTQGVRIEIVDTQKRPMFASASDDVQPYMRDILDAIGHALSSEPNHIVVQGHTDAAPYAGGQSGYSNWELSTSRANAARRQLVAGGLPADKVLRVVGLASVQNLVKDNPLAAENRRISIIVLNERSEAELMHEDKSIALPNAPDVTGNSLAKAMASVSNLQGNLKH